jgi:hypothetical protein
MFGLAQMLIRMLNLALIHPVSQTAVGTNALILIINYSILSFFISNFFLTNFEHVYNSDLQIVE